MSRAIRLAVGTNWCISSKRFGPTSAPSEVRILLDETDIDALIRMKLLKEDQRQDVEALQTAVLGLVYRVQEDLA